jgi:hypothetical protein
MENEIVIKCSFCGRKIRVGHRVISVEECVLGLSSIIRLEETGCYCSLSCLKDDLFKEKPV